MEREYHKDSADRAAREARWILRETARAGLRVGMQRHEVDFVCTRGGEPIIAIPADAAEAVSIGENEVELHAPRLTLQGRLKPIERKDQAERFLAFHPDAAESDLLHLGVGGIKLDGTNLDAEVFVLGDPGWLSEEQFILDHMNEDHVKEMRLMCSHFFSIKEAAPRMIAVDSEGMHLHADGRVLYLRFDSRCDTTREVAMQTVILTRRAQGQET